MTYITSTMSRVGHAQGVGKWVARSNDMANACKQNAHGIRKARAGKCRACAQKGHVQVGTQCAQARKYKRRQMVLLTLGFDYVCDGTGCVWNMYTVPRAKDAQGDCVWITWGVAFQHRLTVYSSSTVQVFVADYTSRLCCNSQQVS